MLPVSNLSTVPLYLEAGNYLKANMVDDSQIIGHNPGPLTRIVVYAKKFLWGMQFFYADGSTTGIHSGLMESMTNPEAVELTLAPGEHIVQISGHIDEYIGAIHIKTNCGNELDIEKTTLGEFFCFSRPGLIIDKIVCGYTGYLSYIGIMFGLDPASRSPVSAPASMRFSASELSTFSASAFSVPPPSSYGCLSSQFVRANTTDVPYKKMTTPESTTTFSGLAVEFTALFGTTDSSTENFNDYEDIVYPALKAGSSVKIVRIKIYKKNNILLGIKPVYEIKDVDGKVKKIKKPHHAKNVGFFTSRSALNFKNEDYLSSISVRVLNGINKITFTSSNRKDKLEYGENEGSPFFIISHSTTGIIALAGSVGDRLRALRGYSLR